MKIGIDVGGTNTDAVLLDGHTVVSAVKRPTAEDITSGVTDSLRSLREESRIKPRDVSAVMLGTTQFVNALVQAQRLTPTAAIRLGLPATSGLPPFSGWPEHLRTAMHGQAFLCHGGFEFDGRSISPIDLAEVRSSVETAVKRGARSLAVSSVFSPVNGDNEQAVAELVHAEFPEMFVSLSHEIGRVGLLERENATIINAALRGLSEEVCAKLQDALGVVDFAGPLFLSQNDGTLMDVDFARKYPVATFASGPTNSMRGAAYLSRLEDCVVVDVGGTTSDIGVLQSGYPREAATEIEVAGVRTNFRMPDVLSIGLGGGSIVSDEDVGPESVGYRVTSEALVFGGSTLTASDVMVAAGRIRMGDPSAVANLPSETITRVRRRITEKMLATIDRMRTSSKPVPVVAVGGGAFLVPDDIPFATEVVHPEHSGVANAIGAAIAQIGGEVDRIYPVPRGERARVLEQAKQEAVDKAISAGAEADTVEIVEVDELPLAYLPGNASRIRVKAVGDLPEGPRPLVEND